MRSWCPRGHASAKCPEGGNALQDLAASRPGASVTSSRSLHPSSAPGLSRIRFDPAELADVVQQPRAQEVAMRLCVGAKRSRRWPWRSGQTFPRMAKGERRFSGIDDGRERVRDGVEPPFVGRRFWLAARLLPRPPAHRGRRDRRSWPTKPWSRRQPREHRRRVPDRTSVRVASVRHVASPRGCRTRSPSTLSVVCAMRSTRERIGISSPARPTGCPSPHQCSSTLRDRLRRRREREAERSGDLCAALAPCLDDFRAPVPRVCPRPAGSA